MRHLIVGCGYLGQRVAKIWQGEGHDVVVLTRSHQRADAFAQRGYSAVVGDVTSRPSLARLPDVDTVLFAVGKDRQSQQTITEVYVEGLRNTIAVLGAVRCFVYISSTGVYGQQDGEWVHEGSETKPVRAGGQACLTAETILRTSQFAERAIRLRLAGIYGPGRIPNQQRLIAGKPITSPSRGYLNLIHVDDAAQVVVRSARQLVPPDLLLVSDGNPVLRADYYRSVAKLLRAPAPTFASPEPDSPAAERAASDKRICNDRLRAQLDYQLLYPTHEDGLRQILLT